MKNQFKKLVPLALVGILSGATTYGAIQYFNNEQNNADYSYFSSAREDGKFSSINNNVISNDFVKASKTTVPAVVTIRNYQNRAGSSNRAMEQDIFEFFFGEGMRGRNQQRETPKDLPSGLGSGVIISNDGYIISNNHVVAGASKLEVVLSNKKVYTAKLIGTDPSTDIALLKIEEKGLPYLNFANSDLVEVGQWVLAVGNPLGLNSTVTAGIVSAKGRSIDLLSQQSRTPIESFIQTDAAINRGNSGGALVNTRGDLIGINSAISSSSGYYEGYGFAVPSNLAKKVVEDIKKFGLVQRGFLGIGTLDLSDDLQVKTYNQRNKTNLKSGKGLYVTEVSKNSGAEDAGIKKGDIIIKIDNTEMLSFADLSLAIGSKRPGDKVSVTYLRDGKEHQKTTSLKDQKGNTSLRGKADLSVTEKIGGEFEPLSDRVKISYGLNSGVIARNIVDGGELAQIGVVDNYIIMEVNGKPVNSQKDIENILNNYNGTVSVVYLDEYGRLTRKGFTMPN